MIGTIALWLIGRNPAMTLPYARRIAKAGLIAAAVVATIVGFLIWDHLDDKAAVDAANARATVEAMTKAREADEAADSANDHTRNEVEQANDEARNAAESGDDPLGDAFRSLRGD